MVPVFSTNWLVAKELSSRKTSWYSWVVLSGLAASLRTEKWRVFRPVPDPSVPLLLLIMSSARRNPVWMFVSEGAKMDLSERVTSVARVPSESKRDTGTVGSLIIWLHVKSICVSFRRETNAIEWLTLSLCVIRAEETCGHIKGSGCASSGHSAFELKRAVLRKSCWCQRQHLKVGGWRNHVKWM